jgi:hypothetical protein
MDIESAPAWSRQKSHRWSCSSSSRSAAQNAAPTAECLPLVRATEELRSGKHSAGKRSLRNCLSRIICCKLRWVAAMTRTLTFLVRVLPRHSGFQDHQMCSDLFGKFSTIPDSSTPLGRRLLNSVLPRHAQSGKFAPSLLSGNEVGIGVFPDIQQLLIAAGGGGFIEVGLGAGGAEQTERVVGCLSI